MRRWRVVVRVLVWTLVGRDGGWMNAMRLSKIHNGRFKECIVAVWKKCRNGTGKIQPYA